MRSGDQRASQAFVRFAAAGLALLSVATCASVAMAGASIMDVKGVRLALPDQGSDTDFITFLNAANRPALSLRWAIAEPKAAQTYFNNSDSIRVVVQAAPEPTRKFLDRFDRSDLRSVEIEFDIGARANADCQSWVQQIDQARSLVAQSSGLTYPDGWAKVSDPADSRRTLYLVQRSDERNRRDDLQCDDLYRCRSSRCLATNIAMTYRFSNNIVERAQWPALIQTIDRLAARIVMNTNLSSQ